jgi:hypothetical protein
VRLELCDSSTGSTSAISRCHCHKVSMSTMLPRRTPTPSAHRSNATARLSANQNALLFERRTSHKRVLNRRLIPVDNQVPMTSNSGSTSIRSTNFLRIGIFFFGDAARRSSTLGTVLFWAALVCDSEKTVRDRTRSGKCRTSFLRLVSMDRSGRVRAPCYNRRRI